MVQIAPYLLGFHPQSLKYFVPRMRNTRNVSGWCKLFV